MKSWDECKALNAIRYRMTVSEIEMTKSYIRRTNPNHLQPSFRKLFLDIISQWKENGTLSRKQQDVLKKSCDVSLAKQHGARPNFPKYDANRMFDVIANPMRGW